MLKTSKSIWNNCIKIISKFIEILEAYKFVYNILEFEQYL